MRWSLLIALCFVSWPLASSAEQVRVAIVTTGGDEELPLVQRLEAELASLSFIPLSVVRGGDEPSEAEIIELAGQVEGRAALFIRPGLAAIDVWTIAAGGRAERRGTIEDRSELGAGSALAIRAAEYLRASLIVVGQPRQVSPERAPPPPVDGRSRPERSHRRLELGLGVGLQWSPGGAGPSGQLLMDAGYLPRRWIGVHLLGVAPIIPAEVTGQEGRAAIRIGLIGGGLRFSLMPAERRVGGAIDVGVAAVVLGMVGEAAEPYTSLRDRLWSAAPYLRPRLVLRLTSWLRLGLDLLVGLASPGVIVRFASRDAASWGSPFLIVGVTLLGALL